jgi:hypothetical protein
LFEDLKIAIELKSNKAIQKDIREHNLRSIKAEIWKSPLPRSRRRTTMQRLGKNCCTIIVIQRGRVDIKIF